MPREADIQKPEDSQEPEDSKWFYQDEIWLDLLRDTFQQFDGQPERAARLFSRLIQALENGAKTDVVDSLENGRRLAFCFTQFHHDCWSLYRYSLSLPEPEANALLERITEVMQKEIPS